LQSYSTLVDLGLKQTALSFISHDRTHALISVEYLLTSPCVDELHLWLKTRVRDRYPPRNSRRV
jgi:hypothetical protein